MENITDLIENAKVQARNGDYAEAVRILSGGRAYDSGTDEEKAEVILFRASARRNINDVRTAMEDYTAVLGLTHATHKQRAEAMHSRGRCKEYSGDHTGAFSDYTAILNSPIAPAEFKARALISRAGCRLELGDAPGEISDLNEVLQMHDAPDEQKALALFNRGYARHNSNPQLAAADYRAVLAMNVSERVKELATNYLASL
jgi:tetratricopeptide (TPR) repeat protein